MNWWGFLLALALAGILHELNNVSWRLREIEKRLAEHFPTRDETLADLELDED